MKRPINSKNARLLREYAAYLRQADGKSEETARQIEKAIHRYQTFSGFEDFARFDAGRAMRFKAAMTDEDLSKATILSTVNALRRFFGWLALQPGFRSKIKATDADYLQLAEKDVRAAKAPSDKSFPSLEQITAALDAMPACTVIERRDRAIVAFTILTGMRDGAIVTLRLKHVDVAQRRVRQDPREVATKASKWIETFFFRVGDGIEAIVLDWIEELRAEHLFGPNDPLFPKTKCGHDEDRFFVAAGIDCDFWSNATPMRVIFRRSFEAIGLPAFTPHRFRDTLAHLAYERCQKPVEFKAWSQNLGHESPLTTLSSYGKLSPAEQSAIIRRTDGSALSDEKITLAMLHKALATLPANVGRDPT
ncbi:site-specific integrase [Aurantimonas sp. E1-2-R+4]|uniref:tyrosine-type recombinase/integrase n=1 Tax=Aurantimonas sp. E1-2-R+4 TaxID=3113714 RepID=UPI002F936D95